MAEITAGELARRLQLELCGSSGRIIRGAAPLDCAGGDQLTFVGAAALFPAARVSQAGCMIAPAQYESQPEQTVLISPQPRAHFAAALHILYPERRVVPGVHPTASVSAAARVDGSAEIGANAVIHPGAVIGAGVRISEGCSVGCEVIIGARTVLHPRVTIYDKVRIGADCVIHSGAVLGADGFGFEMVDGRYRKVPQIGTVEVADSVEIGANTCIDRGTLGATVIGEGTKLDNLVHIAHNCRIGKHVVIAAQTGLAGGVTVGDGAVLGGQVGVGDKARIESKAVVGSGAGILTSKIVRAGEPVWGTPARPLRQYLNSLAALARLSKNRRTS